MFGAPEVGIDAVGPFDPLPAWVLVGDSAPANLDLDFVNNRGWLNGIAQPATALITVSRASSGYASDTSGNWYLFGNNVARQTNKGLLIEESRTNSIRNNSMQGAVVQADSVELLTNGTFTGTSGTGWASGVSGGTGSVNFSVTGQVTLTGDGTHEAYIEQQLTGLVSGRGYVMIGNTTGANINFEVGSTEGAHDLLNVGGATINTNTYGFVAPSNGIAWVRFGRLSATPCVLTSVSVQDGQRVQNGTFTANPINASQNTVQNGWEWTLNSGTGTVTYNSGPQTVSLTGDGTHNAGIVVSIPTLIGAIYTLQFTVATTNIGVVVGNSAFGSALLNTTGVVGTNKFQFVATATTTWVGFVEGTATTSTISNVSVLSAGALPTNWATSSFSNAGLMYAVVGLNTVQGADTIDVRYFGTTTGTSMYAMLFDNSSTAIAASVGQVWASSMFWALVANAGAPISGFSWNFDNVEYPGGHDNSSSTFSSPTSGTITRPTGTTTMAQAGTTNVQPRLNVNGITNSTAYDFTIRFGWPQLELGAFVTSPIRTTSAAVTRAADAVTIVNQPALGGASSFYASAFAISAASATRHLLNGGSGSDRLLYYSSSDNQVDIYNGTNILGAVAGSGAWSTTGAKAACSYGPSGRAIAMNGGTVATDAFSMPGNPTISIGQQGGGGGYANAYILRVAAAQVVWSSTALQSITSGSGP